MSDKQEELRQVQNRLGQLEANYEREITRMVEILDKVQTRLVGSLNDQASPGLIGEVRELKREALEVKQRLDALKVELSALKSAQVASAQVLHDLSEMKDQIPALWKKVRMYDRYRWVIVGVIMACGYIASKAWDYFVQNPK